MAILRQTIITALEARLAAIATPTYRTNLGLNVSTWKRNKFADNHLPAVDIRDTIDDQEVDAEDESLTRHHLQIELVIVGKSAGTSDDLIRQLIADVEQAIAVDDTFSGSALSTEPVSNEIEVEQDGVTIAGATVRIIIHFITAKFLES
jgi:hypothetical protein